MTEGLYIPGRYCACCTAEVPAYGAYEYEPYPVAGTAGVDGAGAGVGAGVLDAGTAGTPGLTLIVLSSRKTVVRPGGRLPYQPGEGERGKVRWMACRTAGGGINGEFS